MPDWRLLDSGPGPGPGNLALDDAILQCVKERRSPPTLRFYSWATPTLSLGYAQEPERDVDADTCRDLGVTVLRRASGGRAVLHDRELTYSVAVPSGSAPFGGGLEAAYCAVAAGLVAGLRLLGVDASPARGASRQARARGRHPGCFAVAARHEIAVGERKLVGSAQRREEGAFLQHGSILIETHGDRLGRLLRAAGAPPPETEMVGLADLLDPCPAPAQIIRALVAGCAEAWGARFVEGHPSREELTLAAQYVAERYLIADKNDKPTVALSG